MDKNTEIKFFGQPEICSHLYGSHFNRSDHMRLFIDILKGIGRNPKHDGKKKGGLKVHMHIDAMQSVGRFIKIAEA